MGVCFNNVLVFSNVVFGWLFSNFVVCFSVWFGGMVEFWIFVVVVFVMS